MSKVFRKPGLKPINNFLSLVVLALAVYIIAAPLSPQISFAWRTKFEEPMPTVAATQDTSSIPSENTLVIPKLHLRETIYGGSDSSALSLGAWRRPHTSTPIHGSNTVIVGHRFTYADPEGVFYHLDKLKPGDTFTIFWNKKAYNYKVSFTEVVSPESTDIEAPTEEPMVTLYTCTPLWSAKDRLIIGAVPVEEQS